MAGVALLLGLFLAASVGDAASLANAALLEEAERAFQAGSAHRDDPAQAPAFFAQAARAYETLQQRGAHNAALYRNQGNAYLLAGDLPHAILAYRRGLRLAPGDGALRTNLAYAREQVATPGSGATSRPVDEVMPAVLAFIPPWLLVAGFASTYTLGWLGLVRWRMVRRPAVLMGTGLAFGLALVLAAGVGVGAWSARYERLHPLVVVAAEGVPLRRGNGRLYPPSSAGSVPRGLEVRLREARGAWLQVELATGALGWLPRSAVLVDTP